MDESIKLILHKPLEDYVTVLAIYDDLPSSSSSAALRRIQEPGCGHRRRISAADTPPHPPHSHVELPPRRPTHAIVPLSRNLRDSSSAGVTVNSSKNPSDDVVEVTTLDDPPTCGLEVAVDESFKSTGTKPSASSFNLKSQVKPSDEFEHKRSMSIDRVSPPLQVLTRNQARKSRLNETFWNAKERLEQRLEDGANISSAGGSALNFRHSKIVFSPETANKFIGVEISAVPDPECPTKILAVEVIRIEDGGRICLDGRIKVGDQITEINGRPCSEMSLAKARRCLRDIEVISEPSLAFNRRAQRGASDANAQRVEIRPIQSALQQANTSKIGDTISVDIRKHNGFGFGFAGRVNAAGEHLYYVTTLRPNGASFGLLKIGDRLLKIDDLNLAEVPQEEITKFLKSKNVGDSITIITSRMTEEAQPSATVADTSTGSVLLGAESDGSSQFNSSIRSQRSLKKPAEPSGPAQLGRAELSDMAAQVADDGQELVELDVSLRDSPSAGLGLSLKAQKIYSDNETIDSGLYIRKLLHGSAAFRDGRLRVDDRLVAIENINLLKFELNAEALEAFTSRLSQMRSSTRSVRIVVARQTPNTPRKSDDLRRAEFVVERNGISSSPVADDASATGPEESESEMSMVPDEDAFVRDTVTRKSISEKRPLGAHKDPSHLQTYQRIKHFRQTSAPLLSNDSNVMRKPSSSDSANVVGILRANRRRSVGAAHLSAAKRRLSFAPGTQATADKFVTRRRPLTVYDDDQKDDDDMELDKSLCQYESKTLPLKSKNSETFKKTSRFFEFFKLNHSNKKSPRDSAANKSNGMLNDDDTKENRTKDASPGRRSVSFDQMGLEFAGLSSRESRLATSLDQAKLIAPKRVHTTADGAVKMASSVSQPTLRSKTADLEVDRQPVEKSYKENSISVTTAAEKHNRRKSTGSGLLKLFQKSAPNSTSQLHAEDEKAAAKYAMLLEDRKRLDSMDETFRREYGLISRHVPSRYSSSPKAERRAPPPDYHKFVQYPPPQFCAPPPQPPPTHRRGHSAHEWSHGAMSRQNCNHSAGPSNNSNNNNRSNFVQIANRHNYDNIAHEYGNTSATSEYSNVVGSTRETIGRWNATHSPTGSNEWSPSSHYCNTNNFDTLVSANLGCSHISTQSITNPSTICPHHRRTSSRQRRPDTADFSAIIPHHIATGSTDDTRPFQRPRPTLPPDYNAIANTTRSTFGSPTASPSHNNNTSRSRWENRNGSSNSNKSNTKTRDQKCRRCKSTATDSYSNLTDRLKSKTNLENRQPNPRLKPSQRNSIQLLMDDEEEDDPCVNDGPSTNVRWAADSSSPSRFWNDSNRVNFCDEDVILAYSTPDNVTNISFGSPINSLWSPNTIKRLGNVSFNLATQFRPNATVFPRSNSQSLNYRTKPPKWSKPDNDRPTHQHYDQILSHAYCTTGIQSHSPLDTVYNESSHRRRTKMRRSVASAVFYDDFDRL